MCVRLKRDVFEAMKDRELTWEMVMLSHPLGQVTLTQATGMSILLPACLPEAE